MEELQQWWEIPSIAQFCSLFRENFNLPEFDLDELEEGFIADGTPGESLFLQDLIVRLLRGCYPRNGVNPGNWGSFLHRILQKRWVKEQGISHPITEGSSFSQLSLRTKVEIVYSLCLYRVDNEDVEQAMKGLDANCLRVQSLGSDENGNVYWYFYGTRLYKEELSESAKKLNDWKKEWEKEQAKVPEPVKRKRGRPRKQQKPVKSDGESEESEECDAQKKGGGAEASKSRWSVVCTTLSDWQQLAESFEKSKSSCEKALHRIITKDFLPALDNLYEQKAKRIKKKMMEFAPRRASSRLEVKKLQKSEEDRLASIVAADEFEMYCEQRNHEESSHPEVRKERVSRDRSRRLVERRQRLSTGIGNGQHHNKDGAFENNQNPHDAFTILDTTHNRSDEFRNFIIKMRQVLVSVKLHKDAWPFLQPVDESYAPGYYDIISNPIDITAIENKLNKGLYENINQVDQDFNLMVDNCQHYNGEESVYSTMAISLRRHFRKSATKCDLLSEYHEEVASKIPCLEVEEEGNVSSSKPTPQKAPELQNKSHVSSENRLKRRRKKRPRGMRAIEALAQASEQALKNATVEAVEPLVSRNQMVYPPNSQAFPDLRIVTIQSHPASLLAKYSSSVSQDSIGSDSFPYSSSLSPESSKENEAEVMLQCQDHSKSLQQSSADETSVDVHSVSQSSLLSEITVRDINDSINNSHDSVLSHSTNSSADGEDSHVFAQVTNTLEVCHPTEFDKETDRNTQQDLSADAQDTHQLMPPEANQSDALSKISSLLSRISSQRSPNFQVNDSQNMEVCETEAENPTSCESSPQRHRESFDNEATPPHMPESPSGQQAVDPTMSPNFGILSTVDASILGLQCSKNLFFRNNSSKNQRLDSLLSSLSPNSAHSIPSSQSPEKALHDVLLGVEFVSDIAKTIHELDKLKRNNSHSPLLGSSGSPPLISSGSNFPLSNQSTVCPEPKDSVGKDSGSPRSLMNSDQNMFSSLLLPKTLGSAIYPVSPDSTETNDKAPSSSDNVNSGNMSGNSSPNSAENSNKSPEHNFASQITGHFFPLTLPLPVGTQADVTNQSSHIPLQLPPSFTHPFISDANGKHVNPALVPSTVPFLVNSTASPLQLTIPSTTSSSSSSPIALIPSPHMLTTVPLSVNMTTTNSSGATRMSPLATTFADSNSSTKDAPKDQSSDSSSSQDSVKPNGSVTKEVNLDDAGKKSSGSMLEMQSSSVMSGYHNSDLQKQPSAAQNQSVPNSSTNQNDVFVNSSIANVPFNIPRPPYCVPSAYNVQMDKSHTQDWNSQNFVDLPHVGNRGVNESARHSVIMAGHQHAKSAQGSVLPVFTTAVSSNSDNTRLRGPPVITTAGKDSGVSVSSLLAQTLPSFVAAQTAPQNVIVNYMTPELNNYSMSNQHFNMQYNVVPSMQGVTYANIKDRPDKNLTVTSSGNSAQYTAVSAVKSSNPPHTFAPSNVPVSVTNTFPVNVSMRTSSTNHGSHTTARTVSKQSNKKASLQSNSAIQKREVAANAYLVPGAQEKLPQVLTNVPGLQAGVPTYYNVPHYIMPSQTGVHGILPQHMLAHSNQVYQPNQRFIMGDTEVSRTTDNRQIILTNRNVQFLTAPSVSTTK